LVTVKMTRVVKKTMWRWQLSSDSIVPTATKSSPLLAACMLARISVHPKERNACLFARAAQRISKEGKCTAK
jgi:hypothetical protein